MRGESLPAENRFVSGSERAQCNLFPASPEEIVLTGSQSARARVVLSQFFERPAMNPDPDGSYGLGLPKLTELGQ